MENEFVKITTKTLAVIFTVMFAATLVGIIFKQVWWHFYTLLVAAILAIEDSHELVTRFGGLTDVAFQVLLVTGADEPQRQADGEQRC